MKAIFSVNRLLIFAIILTLLICFQFSYGQFSVVSTSPSHGSVNVDTSVTLSITFNSAIDTTVRFPFPGDFFMNLFFDPDTLVNEPDSITLSPDLQTVYFHNV